MDHHRQFPRILAASIAVAAGVALSTTSAVRASNPGQMWTYACAKSQGCAPADYVALWAGGAGSRDEVAFGVTGGYWQVISLRPPQFKFVCDTSGSRFLAHFGKPADQYGKVVEYVTYMGPTCGQEFCFFACDCAGNCNNNCPVTGGLTKGNWSTPQNTWATYVSCQ
jgi:hypothetical protein